jgi:hypothetical protein
MGRRTGRGSAEEVAMAGGRIVLFEEWTTLVAGGPYESKATEVVAFGTINVLIRAPGLITGPASFQLEGSNDGMEWFPVGTATSITTPTPVDTSFTTGFAMVRMVAMVTAGSITCAVTGVARDN